MAVIPCAHRNCHRRGCEYVSVEFPGDPVAVSLYVCRVHAAELDNSKAPAGAYYSEDPPMANVEDRLYLELLEKYPEGLTLKGVAKHLKVPQGTALDRLRRLDVEGKARTDGTLWRRHNDELHAWREWARKLAGPNAPEDDAGLRRRLDGPLFGEASPALRAWREWARSTAGADASDAHLMTLIDAKVVEADVTRLGAWLVWARRITGAEVTASDEELQIKVEAALLDQHGSVLPMVMDDGSTIVVESISGGADSIDGEPRRLTLCLTDAEGNERRVHYRREETERATINTAGPSWVVHPGPGSAVAELAELRGWRDGVREAIAALGAR